MRKGFAGCICTQDFEEWLFVLLSAYWHVYAHICELTCMSSLYMSQVKEVTAALILGVTVLTLLVALFLTLR
jgi:hypothetical protein